MRSNHVSPSISLGAFCCPFCNSFAHQEWSALVKTKLDGLPQLLNKVQKSIVERRGSRNFETESQVKEVVADRVALINQTKILREIEEVVNLHLSRCAHCQGVSVWVHDTLVFPLSNIGPAPNQDLPSEIKKDFEEARSIAQLSPRGAAALLRLAIQKLCGELGESGKNINSDISNLVKKGLDPRIQKALDIVRVIGNEAVHPGTMNIDDDFEAVSQLFLLVNLIAERMITHPKAIDEIYSQLPGDKITAIEKRDGK